jgi:hypothetical protein
MQAAELFGAAYQERIARNWRSVTLRRDRRGFGLTVASKGKSAFKHSAINSSFRNLGTSVVELALPLVYQQVLRN